MRTRRGIILASLLAFLLCGIGPADAAEIVWAKSLKVALATAKKTNQLVMVDFYTDWCGWCKRLDKDVYPAPPVVKSAKNFVSVKVNAEREGIEAARKYKVTSFPTVLFLSPSGTVEGIIGGYAPAPQFAAEMNRISQQYQELPVLAAKVHAGKADLPTLARYTRIQAGRGGVKEAQSGLTRIRTLDPKNTQGYLATGLNYVGQMFLTRQEPLKATPLFQQVLNVSRKSEDRGYAHLMLAFTRVSARDLNGAIKELNATLADSRVSATDKERARGLLTKLTPPTSHR